MKTLITIIPYIQKIEKRLNKLRRDMEIVFFKKDPSRRDQILQKKKEKNVNTWQQKLFKVKHKEEKRVKNKHR